MSNLRVLVQVPFTWQQQSSNKLKLGCTSCIIVSRVRACNRRRSGQDCLCPWNTPIRQSMHKSHCRSIMTWSVYTLSSWSKLSHTCICIVIIMIILLVYGGGGGHSPPPPLSIATKIMHPYSIMYIHVDIELSTSLSCPNWISSPQITFSFALHAGENNTTSFWCSLLTDTCCSVEVVDHECLLYIDRKLISLKPVWNWVSY